MDRSELHVGRLIALVGIVIASVLLWDSAVLTPFKLLAVMGHETGHALAAKLVGGEVNQVTVRLNQSGECLSSIPQGFFAKVLVYSGGYVGSAIIAVALLVLTYRFNARRFMLGAAAVWLLVMALFYGRDLFTLGFCIGMAVLFAAGARWLPLEFVGGLNLFIATFTALYAAMDLKDDLWTREVRAMSDAQLLANVTIVPAIVWALLWTLLSVAILALGGWFALRERKAPAPTPKALTTPA
ncbi:MAG: M50 family metallopeptidase [Myxococcaceae bacterium]|nr:M50 family metallopeptidase [Myxococcaceae bacterium]